MKKMLIIVLCCGSIAGTCLAQGAMEPLTVEDSPPLSAQLFHLNAEQYNHHFDFILPNDGQLQVDFLRLSDWGTQNQLQAVTLMAAQQVRALKDSFRNEYTAKVLEMNVPIDGNVISLSYREDGNGKNQLAFKDGAYYQLKATFDTIRLIRNIGVRTTPLVDSGLIQVQYTFILKDLSDIEALADNPAVMNQIGTLADAAINKQRARWKHQDRGHLTLNLKYDPNAKQPMVSDNDDGAVLSFLTKRFSIFLAVGAAVYTNNAIAPFVDESIAYLIPSRTRLQPFVGLNITAFGFIASDGSRWSYNSYNFEYGLCKRPTKGLMQQRTSIVLGIMEPRNTPDTKTLFHMGFNFGFNSFLSAGFFAASDFNKDSNNDLLGVNFKFNL